jgi:DNA-binding transcriptional ArsR family regulator
MDNTILFKALSSKTRIMILKILLKEKMHLSKLSKKIGYSKPVISKHVKILEKAGLVRKEKIGNVHLLHADISKIDQIFESFIEEKEVEIEKNNTLFDGLKQIPGIKIKKKNGKQYITSIDGEKGFYIYEVNGDTPEVPIDEFKPEKNVNIKIKRITSVEKKDINIKIKK